jgi:hypothetical protein
MSAGSIDPLPILVTAGAIAAVLVWFFVVRRRD